MRTTHRFATIALAAALLLAGCTSGGVNTESPVAASDARPPLRMVVIGDSIPFTDFCGPGCIGFDDLYAADLEAKTGRTVEVTNRSRDDTAGVADIQRQVTSDESLRTQIVAADIIIVSVGFNSVLPDPETGIGCLGDLGKGMEGVIAWTFTTKPACLRAQITTYAKRYDVIFKTIAAIRGDAPTVLAALNVYDGNIGSPEWRVADEPQSTIDAVDRWLIDAYDRWNPMLCDQAARHGFTCVDVYHAFNGPKGTRPNGDLTVDGAHPSQRGNDLIAELLAEIDVSAITDASS
jgi:lysophospholipase L1-like esterase